MKRGGGPCRKKRAWQEWGRYWVPRQFTQRRQKSLARVGGSEGKRYKEGKKGEKSSMEGKLGRRLLKEGGSGVEKERKIKFEDQG